MISFGIEIAMKNTPRNNKPSFMLFFAYECDNIWVKIRSVNSVSLTVYNSLEMTSRIIPTAKSVRNPSSQLLNFSWAFLSRFLLPICFPPYNYILAYRTRYVNTFIVIWNCFWRPISSSYLNTISLVLFPVQSGSQLNQSLCSPCQLRLQHILVHSHHCANL